MYRKNILENVTEEKINAMMDFCEDYKDFLTECKTERLAVMESVRLARDCGYKSLDEYDSLKSGDKVYVVNKDKNIMLFIMGDRPLTDGLRILGAHIDSPRLDLKQNPLYEDNGFALFDTHYYGGVKKYQWTAIPLSLIGVVCRKDGSIVDINIGEDPSDPVVGIGDLLIHLAKDQMDKKLSEAISGENLDVMAGSMPLIDNENKSEEGNEDGKTDISGNKVSTEKDAIKKNILAILKDKYGIEEEDFVSAEIEVVPAGPARDYGIDRSMISGYGHDDRVCGYTSLRAILDSEKQEFTSCCVLVYKEEIGSVGATGAHSLFFENTIARLLAKTGITDFVSVRTAIENSRMLSSDVSAGFEPLYPSVSDKNNAAFLNNGIAFNKYTGARGKSGSNDANPEYIAWIRRILDEENIYYQTCELGKVDQGGGGTIAYILGNYNMNVIDAGIAVLNMHAPMEVVSKADVYETYLAYKVFLSK